MWCHGSGVLLDGIDSWSLSFFLIVVLLSRVCLWLCYIVSSLWFHGLIALWYVIVAFSGHSHLFYARMINCAVYRGSYMSAHFYWIYQTSWRKEIKCEACRSLNSFATSLINLIISEQECYILFITWHLNCIKSYFWRENVMVLTLLPILLHSVISLPDATSCNKLW